MINRYIELPGGYSYAVHSVGMSLVNPQGKEIYIQPGDDEAAMMTTLEALLDTGPYQIAALTPEKAAIITDIALSEYFER